MGSVIDYIDCPSCGNEAYNDFYYKTGEEYTNCSHCGYHYSATIKNRDKKLNELTEEDWEIKELKNPYGAFKIKQYDTIGYLCGSIENEEHLNELKTNCENDLTVEYLFVYKIVDGESTETILVDNGPKFDSQGFSEEDRITK